MDKHPEPDIKWYIEESQRLKLSPRCPIAAKNLCPRYDVTLELLHKAGKIPYYSPPENRLDDELLEPNAPYASGGEELHNFSWVCPEVMADTIGLFVAGYSFPEGHEEMGDVWDEKFYYKNARHYSQCREYSVFTGVQGNSQKASKRKGISSSLRWKIIQRDKFQCQYCGRKPPEVTLEVDHRVPVARGGTDDPENLFTACRDCNQGKGTRHLKAP